MGHTPAMQPDAIRHEFADVNGIRLHYASAGAGKLIIFLHGFPEFWYAWRKQLAEFGQRFLAVAPDMRGYNLSSKPEEIAEYAIGKLVGDVRALVDTSARASFARGNLLSRGTRLGRDGRLGRGHQFPRVGRAPRDHQRAASENVSARAARKSQAAGSQPVHARVSQPAGGSHDVRESISRYLQETMLGELIRQGHYHGSRPESVCGSLVAARRASTGGLNYYRAAEVPAPGDAAGKRRLRFQRRVAVVGCESADARNLG